jgi:hypothetical protein
MPRMTDDEKLAALEKRKAEIKAQQLRLNRELRAVQSHKKDQARRDRAHAGIVVGLEMIEHAIRNPGSDVRRVVLRIVENHLAKRPDDQPLAELLDQLTAAAAVPEAAE